MTGFFPLAFLVACINILFPFFDEQDSIARIDHTLSVHPLMDIWAISILGLVGIMLLGIFMYGFLRGQTFSILLSTYLGMELLNHTVTRCLTFQQTARPFSKTAAPFYIPTRSKRGFRFLLILSKTCYFVSFSLL